jgi:hypothetical protein
MERCVAITGSPERLLTWLKHLSGSPEFFAECARISELVKMAVPPKPGTLGLLIAEYRASTAFLDLQPRTQSDYQRCLDYLKPIADMPLARFDRGPCRSHP